MFRRRGWEIGGDRRRRWRGWVVEEEMEGMGSRGGDGRRRR